MSERSPSPALATAALVVHALLALLVVGLAAEPLRGLASCLRRPVCLAEEVPSPAWVAPLLFALVFVGARLWTYLRGRALPLVWTWAAVIALAATLIARAVEPDPAALAYSSIHDAPAAIQTVEALKLLKAAVTESLEKRHAVPDEAELHQALRVDGRELAPRYRYRAFGRRPFHVELVLGAPGPVEHPYPGDQAGTLYVAVSPDGQHFWLTAVVLLAERGEPTSQMLPGPEGITVLSNSPTG